MDAITDDLLAKALEVEAKAKEAIAAKQQEQEKTQAFLVELTTLSQKHGIFIGGCSCCGSPFLFPVEGDNLEYDEEQQCYILNKK